MTVSLDRVRVADAGVVADAEPRVPDPEVPERARRRSFTARYKLEVLAAYDAAGPGEKGAILRREGLYSSHIVEWRRAPMPGRWRAWPSRVAAVREMHGWSYRQAQAWSSWGQQYQAAHFR